MSAARIAGLLGTGDLAQRHLEKGLSVARGHGDWETTTLAVEEGRLGWTGLGAPQTARDGDVVVVLDGVFFNREELPAAESDAARLAALYRQYGLAEACARVNGDFAVAVYDAGSRALLLARDRFGTKPLYYSTPSAGTGFASRPASLLEFPGVSSTPDHGYVARFAGGHYRYFDVEPGASPFRDIARVPPAHVVSIRDGEVRVAPYWQLADAPRWELTGEELASQYRELLIDSVRRRLSVCERPAFTLSGGMDSSSVLACAVMLEERRLPAFSTVYQDETYDESEDIRTILADCVDPWSVVKIGTPDVFGLIRRMVRLHDEPVATATWLSHLMLTEAVAAAGHDAVLGGLGGDELNAGEFEHFFFFFADLRAAGDERALAEEIAGWVRHHDHPIYLKNKGVAEEVMSRVVDSAVPGRCLPERKRMERYASALDPGFFELEKFAPPMPHPFASYLDTRTWQDLTSETIPPCLRAEDRHTAALGLGNFQPFLDHRLVEFMWRVPVQEKYQRGVTKHLLRRAMKGVLPDETRQRVAKTGWNAPAHLWFSGEGADQVRDLVRDRRFRARGIYRLDEVERIVDEHVAIVEGGQPRENHMMFLWQLVNLELWFREYSDGDRS